ncbi:MAG: L,D-transpeptidase family protein [Candidatus Aminicenantes bacterium]|nr:L,D-transpeptidase family protein [Candidatus Aminicenantes bacterium]NIM82314.1 L,D-transpeptidase family protein [Candidatus Aminicenantes bacterium]NIN21697.1 L,D-transpeptidase family protein [Candidatus Aminicenantes bacterium]NIN45506.1 L,D-transpeptidase family protein [Candidatus Aminicenantes bacterium]NIN88337.1 L,D-transpeptidase family protein [Candidatus Aminicenantes bacterium]
MNWKSYRIFILLIFIFMTMLPFLLTALTADQEQKIPDCLLSYRFGPEQHMLIVEKSTQNLFVYSNYNAEPVDRFKITSGKNNGPKLEEGDMKTPEGIYFFRNILSGGELPKADDYGEKAFTLNYPNPIDRKEGKDGSGIWLHGAFDGDKINIPYNSRGCVVMKNKDLVRLSKYIFLNQTPICIYNKIKYETIENIREKRDCLIGYLKEWKSNWEDKNLDGYIGYYDPGFSYSRMNLKQFKAFKQRLNQRYRFIRVILSDINIYGFKNYHVTMFNQLYISDINHFYNKKIQYWQDVADKARIVDEFSVRLPPPTKFEFSKGNYITIEEFQKDYLKQMESKTISIAPAEIHLKNVSIFGQTVKLFLKSSGDLSKVRVVPVLKLEHNGDTTLKTLEGITFKRGAPRGYSQAIALDGRETTVVMRKDKKAQLKSLTLFLINRENDVEQIITYIINQ